MDHLAIMKKSWGLLPKILTGEKTIESRWYKTKYRPWDNIQTRDVVYFKDSGKLVSVKTEVRKVIQFSNLIPEKVKEILEKYGENDGLGIDDIPRFFEMFKNKKYCILVFLKNPKKIKPFRINKKGYGTMSAWIVVNDISQIKIK
ncbi:MAG: hypothetical protein KJI70_01440 [Patescibacteria group bacterium]|nr:hypothetical protein [Patescibacteria group bacterium]